jgi:hypothetical protein
MLEPDGLSVRDQFFPKRAIGMRCRCPRQNSERRAGVAACGNLGNVEKVTNGTAHLAEGRRYGGTVDSFSTRRTNSPVANFNVPDGRIKPAQPLSKIPLRCPTGRAQTRPERTEKVVQLRKGSRYTHAQPRCTCSIPGLGASNSSRATNATNDCSAVNASSTADRLPAPFSGPCPAEATALRAISRLRRLASYSGQFVTRCAIFGM